MEGRGWDTGEGGHWAGKEGPGQQGPTGQHKEGSCSVLTVLPWGHLRIPVPGREMLPLAPQAPQALFTKSKRV